MRLAITAHPPGAQARALAQQTGVMDLPPAIPTPPDRLRLVIQHIGEATPDEAAGILESLRRACRGLEPFRLRPLRIVSTPRNAPARRVAVELDSPPALLELKRRLARRLASSPRRDPADRFIPKIPLLRFETPATGLDIDETIVAPGFRVDRITLEETQRARTRPARKPPSPPVGVVRLRG